MKQSSTPLDRLKAAFAKARDADPDGNYFLLLVVRDGEDEGTHHFEYIIPDDEAEALSSETTESAPTYDANFTECKLADGYTKEFVGDPKFLVAPQYTRDIRDIRGGAEADDVGVERFAQAMSHKLAKKRADGYGGWNHEPYTVQPDRSDRVQRFGCTVSDLRKMLSKHFAHANGDMLDVANFAMMIWNREHPNGK